MKDLIGKAESMMNVILLISLVLAWACIGSWNDPVAIGLRLYLAVGRVPVAQQSEAMKNFWNAVSNQSAEEKRDKVSQVSVDAALAIRGSLDNAPNVRQVDAQVRELEAMHALASVTNPITFAEFRDRVNPQIKVPFIDQELNSKSAIVVLSVGLLGPYAYLASLMLAIGAALKHDERSEGSGWLFFHPGRIGVVLGVIWLLGPSIALFVGSCAVPVDRHLRMGCCIGLALAACFPIVQAMRLRNSSQSKQSVSYRK